MHANSNRNLDRLFFSWIGANFFLTRNRSGQRARERWRKSNKLSKVTYERVYLSIQYNIVISEFILDESIENLVGKK